MFGAQKNKKTGEKENKKTKKQFGEQITGEMVAAQKSFCIKIYYV